MSRALELARQAALEGGVPVGAVSAKDATGERRAATLCPMQN